MNRRRSAGEWIAGIPALSQGIRRALILIGALVWITFVVAFARVAVRAVTGGAA